MSNFIPNETIKVTPRDPLWITRQLKTMFKKKKRFKKRHGYQPHNKIGFDNFPKECLNTIESSKVNYIRNLGNKLADPKTSQKTYWKTFEKVMNNRKAPRSPPLLINNKFIINCNLYIIIVCFPTSLIIQINV